MKNCKFSKKIIVLCMVFIIFYTIIQLYMCYKLKIEISPTLTTCVYAFFGTELAASAFIKVCEKDKKENKSEDSISEDIDEELEE